MTRRQESDTAELAGQILAKIREFGADVAGLARVKDLKNGPSERLFPHMKDHTRDRYAADLTTGLPHGAVLWEPEAQTAIVFGISHPKEHPELDWWLGEINPPGNKKLLAVSKKTRTWLKETYPEMQVFSKPYHVERGGIYLKEAAYFAGLGCIGRNNLLVNPQFGPRLRLRALLISAELPPTGPIPFDPCAACPGYCIKSCPQQAFSEIIYTPEETGLAYLPGRNGSYSRLKCNIQMQKNEEEAQVGIMPEVQPEPDKIMKYCRACEFSCPVGK